MTARLRIILPPLPVIFVFWLLCLMLEVPIHIAQWRWGGPPPLARPVLALVSLAAAAYGVYRVVAFHPFYRPDYREWLAHTPWTVAKPLPVGPVAFVWEDLVVLAGFVLLTLAQPLLDPVRLVNFCLLAYLAALALTLWPTGAGVFGYAVAFGVGLAIRLFPDPWASLAAAIGTYVVAYVGLHVSLARFPWTLEWEKAIAAGASAGNTDKFFEHFAGPACGWPYDRLRPRLVQPLRLGGRDALLVSLLAGWWLFALEGLLPDQRDRILLAFLVLTMTTILLPAARFVLYRSGYAPPIDLWGRLATFRWIIPGYDQIVVGPVCALLVGPSTIMMAPWWGLPAEVAIPIALSLVILVTLVARPSLVQWRLTGHHRLTYNVSAQRKSEFIQVG